MTLKIGEYELQQVESLIDRLELDFLEDWLVMETLRELIRLARERQ